MGYISANLRPGERVLHAGAVHWAIHLGPAALILLGLGAALVEPASLLVALVGAATLAATLLHARTTEMAVTDRRVIVKSGIVGRAAFEVGIDRVEGVSLEQSVPGRLLGFGTLWGSGAGTRTPIPMVADPTRFRNALVDILERRGA